MKDGYVELQVGAQIYQIPRHKKTEIISIMVGFESKEALSADVANDRLKEAHNTIGNQQIEIERLNDVVTEAGEKLAACSKQLEEAMDANVALVETNTELGNQLLALGNDDAGDPPSDG